MKKIILYTTFCLFSFSTLNAQSPFEYKEFTVDVAINWLSTISNGPVDTVCEWQAAGSNYIIRQGIIYTEGTLDCNGIVEPFEPCNNVDGIPSIDVSYCGVDSTGAAEFNDDIIGDWDCRGWFTQDVAIAYQGTFDISTQTFYLDSMAVDGIIGEGSITTDGIVGAAFNVPIKRAIVGGTGAFRYAMGEVVQELIGYNATGGYNIRTTFKLYYISQ